MAGPTWLCLKFVLNGWVEREYISIHFKFASYKQEQENDWRNRVLRW